jgi:hypothetical protein
MSYLEDKLIGDLQVVNHPSKVAWMKGDEWGTYFYFRTENGTMYLSYEPTNSLRGQFKVHVEPKPRQYDFFIDEMDRWPRHYFKLENALDELYYFLDKSGEL